MSEKDLNKNVKVYPTYRAFGYDFLFLWTISILYLTEIKGFSYSQVIFLDAVLMLVGFSLQIPVSKLIKKLGRVQMARIASVAWLGFALIYLFGEGMPIFIFANMLYGLGMAIRNITDLEIISLSLKKLNRKKEFSRYEGKAVFIYNIIEGITAILAGYLYEFVSPYAPIIGTVACCAVALVLSIIIKDPLDEDADEIELVQDSKPKREPSYKALLKRPFVIGMIVFCFCFYGITSVQTSLAKMYFQNINTPAYLLGYIMCVFKLINALTAKYEFKYELRKGVRSLIIFVTLVLTAYVTNGIIYAINPTAVLSIIAITIMFTGQQVSRSAYRIATKNYINTCTTKTALTKTLTIYSMAECLGYACVTLFTSLVLELSNNSFTITNLSLVGLLGIPLIVGTVLFVRALIKSYTHRCTIIRKEMLDDD